MTGRVNPVICALIFLVAFQQSFAQDHPLIPNADFTVPAVVMLGEPVDITNLTTGGTSFYWNFCPGSVIGTPATDNIGNPGFLLSVPTYITLVEDGQRHFSFICDQVSRGVIRYDHGVSFLNDPVSGVLLGDFGILTSNVEGIQVLKDNGQWYGFVCNGSSIVRLNFGLSPDNTPTAATLSGTLNMPHCLKIVEENGQWIGFVTCSLGGNLVRLRFGNSLTNNPILDDLGSIGGLSLPGAFGLSLEGTNWYMLIMNTGIQKIVRLDFGNSLLNAPAALTAINIGQISSPLGWLLLRDCETVEGYICNYQPAGSANLLSKITFPNGVTGAGSVAGLGNPGDLDRPHSFSELFRVGDVAYAYLTNRGNATMTRIAWPACSNPDPPSSTLFDPPVYSYQQPGTYTVHLLVDEGLPTQQSVCKTIQVVTDPDAVLARFSFEHDTVCAGQPVNMVNTSQGGDTYIWSVCGGTVSDVPGWSDTGNPSGSMLAPAGMTLVAQGNECFSFVSDRGRRAVIRNYYGTGFKGPVISTALLDAQGLFNDQMDGLAIVQYQGIWFGFVCNGSSIVRLDFGNSLWNNPVPVLLGSGGSLSQGGGIILSKEGMLWIGMVSDRSGSKIVKLVFPDGLQQPPAMTALGNSGLFNHPGSLKLVIENGKRYLFVVNEGNGNLSRLSFGHTLTSVPAGVILGQVVNSPAGGIMLTRGCNGYFGYVSRNDPQGTTGLIRKITFPDGIEGRVEATNIAFPAWLDKPACFSETFFDRDTIFAFLANQAAPALSLMGTPFCSESVIPPVNSYAPPALVIDTPGIYRVGLLVNHGMPDEVVLCKDVNVRECDLPLWFPNVFTPNGDGVNDFFFPVGYGVADFHITIFNRWGEEIYDADTIKPGWDGRFHDRACSDGVYVFIATYSMTENAGSFFTYRGSITLLR